MDLLPIRWRALAARAVLSLLFATLTLAHGSLSLMALATMFTALALGDSCLTVFCTVRDARPRGILRIQATVGMLAGAAIAIMPHVSAQRLIAVMSAWALVGGLCDIGLEIRLRRSLGHVRGALLVALVSLGGAAGFCILLATGVFSPGLWLGLYTLLAGAATAVLALRLRDAEIRYAVLDLAPVGVGRVGSLYALIK